MLVLLVTARSMLWSMNCNSMRCPLLVLCSLTAGMAGVIATKLQQIVTANRLERFYPLHTLPALAARLDARVNFADLAAR